MSSIRMKSHSSQHVYPCVTCAQHNNNNNNRTDKERTEATLADDDKHAYSNAVDAMFSFIVIVLDLECCCF